MANFRNDSGNSRQGVEMIAVVRPGRETEKSQYVEVMVNNSAVKKADAAKGMGQGDPNLYTKTTTFTDEKTGEKKTGYDHGIRLTKDQFAAIENAGGSKALEKEDGTRYIPFKADVMPLNQTVKDKEGNPVKDENGKNKTQMVGYMPNTKTIEPTELGNLTQNRLDKHFENTKTINEAQKAQKAASKAAKLEATASAPSVESSAEKSNEASL